MNSQAKRGPCLKASRYQVTTPYFTSSIRQPKPISIQGETHTRARAHTHTHTHIYTHATHSHALVGNQEKFICVNRSNREQQNPPACSQDTLESGMSQSVRGQSRGREDALAGECRAVQREPVARKRYFLHRGSDGARAPPWGDNHPLPRPKNKSRYIVPSNGSMFLGCKLIGHGRGSRFWQ